MTSVFGKVLNKGNNSDFVKWKRGLRAIIQEHSLDFRAVIGQYVKILGKGLPHVLEKK